MKIWQKAILGVLIIVTPIEIYCIHHQPKHIRHVADDTKKKT